VIYFKFNNNFKNHINFRGIKKKRYKYGIYVAFAILEVTMLIVK